MSTNNKDDDDDNGRQEKEKGKKKKEICQIPFIKSIFSVFGLLFKKLNASANRQVHSC